MQSWIEQMTKCGWLASRLLQLLQAGWLRPWLLCSRVRAGGLPWAALVVGLLGLLLLVPAASAQDAKEPAASDWQRNERVAVRLVSATTGVGDLATLTLGLEVELAPGWHSYWRSPGEAGLPPQLETSASTNVGQLEILYPWPQQKMIMGIENFLYEHRVLYPLLLTPTTPGQPVRLQAKLSLLTCEEICVPNDFTLALDLPAAAAAPSPFAAAIVAARELVPQPLTLETLRQQGAGGALVQADRERAGLWVSLCNGTGDPGTLLGYNTEASWIVENNLGLSFLPPAAAASQPTSPPSLPPDLAACEATGSFFSRDWLPLRDASQAAMLEQLTAVTLVWALREEGRLSHSIFWEISLPTELVPERILPASWATADRPAPEFSLTKNGAGLLFEFCHDGDAVLGWGAGDTIIVENNLGLSFLPAVAVAPAEIAARLAECKQGYAGAVLLPLRDASQESLLAELREVTLVWHAPDKNPPTYFEMTLPIAAPVAMPLTAPVSPAAAPSLLLVVLFALVGGFILNFMPCVLPVLALKVAGLVQQREDATQVRVSFLWSALGIVVSFLVLAALALLARQLGLALGWGAQFQEPVFVALLAAVVVLFAANLFGLWEISLSSNVQTKLHELGQARRPHAAHFWPHFSQGALATILATPCTAPFLGTATAFALSAPPLTLLLLYGAMGLGLALPYLLVAARPQLVAWLPRPGRWMLWLRGLLGVLLLGTAAWLVFVLAAQLADAVWQGVAGGLLLLVLLLVFRQTLRTPVLRQLCMLGVLVLVGAVLLVAAYGARYDASVAAATMQPTGQPMVESSAGLAWQQYEATKIAPTVAEGKLVLVDATARWCLTCLFNKRTVLEQEPTRSLLLQPDVLLLRADWTNGDPAVSALLQAHGRVGIPFNIVYGPAAPEGIVLPELLSHAAVAAALAAARGQ